MNVVSRDLWFGQWATKKSSVGCQKNTKLFTKNVFGMKVVDKFCMGNNYCSVIKSLLGNQSLYNVKIQKITLKSENLF